MKIDFNSQFKDIAKLLRSPAQQRPEAASTRSFGKLLGEIAPHGNQPIDITKDLSRSEPSGVTHEPKTESAKASLNWPTPELMEPNIRKVEVKEIFQDKELERSESVKKPTVLSVQRKEVEPQLVELPKNSRMSAVKEMVDAAGSLHGIDPLLGLAVAGAESSYNPNAVSSDGHYSKGLFQLLDSTGKELHTAAGIQESYDPFDPEQNVELGVRYLRRLHDSFAQETTLSNEMKTYAAANSSSLEKLAVAAFNAGEGRVASAQQRATTAGMDPTNYDHISSYLPKSTQEYVERVMRIKGDISADLDSDL